MGLFSGIGKVLKKVLPIAAVAAPFIPGVGPLIGAGLGAASKLFGGSQPTSSPAPIPVEASTNDAGANVLPPQQVNGSKAVDWGGIAGAVGAMGTGYLSYQGQQQTNAANASQAQKQMDFQAEQTGTAYQRATADMKASGLNPMLAYSQGGASSGGGAQATMGNALGAGVSSALQGAQQIVAVKNVQADTDSKRANIDLTVLDQALREEQTGQSAASAAHTRALEANARADLQRIISEGQVAKESAPAQIRGHFAKARLGESQARLSGYEEPGAKHQARADEALGIGKPIVNEVGKLLNSAASGRRALRSFIPRN